jgi:hypothetical protein
MELYMSKSDYSSSSRRRMAESGEAMPDGSFPIAKADDLRNALQSVRQQSVSESARRHITSRARALGLTDMLPEDWKKRDQSMDKFWGGIVNGPMNYKI